MTQASPGKTVKVDYTGRLDNGSVFDSTKDQQPIQFVLGENRLIRGFEQAVLGMSPGESKSVKLKPEEAYGSRRDDMVVTIDRNGLANEVEPQVGQKVEVKSQDGSAIGATVTEVTESQVTLDANHPLAGQTLIFDIALVEVA